MTGVGGSTGACCYRGFDGPRPGSSGKSEQGGERRTGTLTREVHRPDAGAEDLSGRTSVKRGAEGTGGSYHGTRDRIAGPSPYRHRR